jgi:hypothetical protein
MLGVIVEYLALDCRCEDAGIVRDIPEHAGLYVLLRSFSQYFDVLSDYIGHVTARIVPVRFVAH